MSSMRFTILVVIFLAGACISQQTSDMPDTPYSQLGNYTYPIELPKPDSGGMGLGQFGSGGSASQKPKLDLIFVVEPASPLVLWKDNNYDYYDGAVWSQTNKSSAHVTSAQGNGTSRQYNFTITKTIPEEGMYRLISPSNSISRTWLGKNSFGAVPDAYGNYFVQAPFASNISYDSTYEVLDISKYSGSHSDLVPGEELSNTEKQATLRLYDNISASVLELSKSLLIQNASALEQAIHDTRHIKNNYVYSLEWANESQLEGNPDILGIVLQNKKGFCIHYATLLAMILRSQGVPSRLATGYAGGFPYGNKTYVLGSYAHAWTEVYDPVLGWVAFDATPSTVEDEQTGQPVQAATKSEVELEWSQIGMTSPQLRLILHKRTLSELSGSDGSGNASGNQSEMQRIMNTSDFSSFFNSSAGNMSRTGNSTSPGNFSSNSSNGNFSSNSSIGNIFNWSSHKNSTSSNTSLPNSSKWQDDLKKNASATEPPPPKEELEQDVEEESGKYLLATAAIAVVSALACVLLLIYIAIAVKSRFLDQKTGTADTQKKLAHAQKIFKQIDLDRLVAQVESAGQSGDFRQGAIIAYRGLEDYIAFVSRLFNDPNLTAREYSQLVKETAHYNEIRDLTGSFENARYTSGRGYEKEFQKSLSALKKIRENERGRAV